MTAGRSRMDAVRRCRPCWQGNCAECTSWTDRTSVCEHVCDELGRQLLLPLGDSVLCETGNAVESGQVSDG